VGFYTLKQINPPNYKILTQLDNAPDEEVLADSIDHVVYKWSCTGKRYPETYYHQGRETDKN
jgi:hypothetical protein